MALALLLALAASGLVAPEPLELPPIARPDGAPPQGADVTVELTIDEVGRVTDVKLVTGAGEPFDSAVIAGVRRFRFRPAHEEGVAVSVRLPLTQHFEPAADEAILEGTLIERGTRRPIAGASLVAEVAGKTTEVETDSSGRFSLPLVAGDVSVRIVAGGRPVFRQRETLHPHERLTVTYLLDPEESGAYSTTVVGTRDRTEVSRTTLRDREITHLPGSFGDPYRVVLALPGVEQVMSLLPLPIVRGASPGQTGMRLDGVRLPLLFHLLGGPSVVHPEFLEAVDFQPGGFPVEFGGDTAGLVNGLTRAPRPGESRLDLNADLTQSGVFVRRPIEPLGITATVAGRYGYPGLLLRALAPGIGLSYWDYQARLEGSTRLGRWVVFAFGAGDSLSIADTSKPDSKLSPVAAFSFHRLDLRFVQGDPDRGALYRLVLGLDRTDLDTGTYGHIQWQMVDIPGLHASPRSISASPSAAWHLRLGESFQLRAGLEASVSRSEAGQDVLAVANGTLTSAGAWVELPWSLGPVAVVPGVRADVWRDSELLQASVDPRLSGRLRVSETLALKAATGIYHQPPRPFVPLPGTERSTLALGLLLVHQSSAGAEVTIRPGVEFQAQAYLNRGDPVVDLVLSQPVSAYQTQPPSQLPWEASSPGVPARANNGADPFANLFTPQQARSYGLELMLRKAEDERLFGWIAYSLGRSERRQADGTWAPSDFDRTHIASVVFGTRLPRGWELGSRVLVQSGTPLTNVSGFNAGRTATMFRVDLRVDRRVVWNSWMLDFYADILNATFAPESGGIIGAGRFSYPVPMVGVRGVL